MANSVLRTKYGNWVHGRSAKIKKVTARLAMHLGYLRINGRTFKNTTQKLK